MFKTFTLYISFFFIFILNLLIADNKQIECSICEKLIKEKAYLVDIWGNPFHLKHKNEGKFCESCSRIISRKITSGGYQLSDGRHICSLCDVSIIETARIHESLINVINIFKKNGLQNINRNEIDIKIIDKDEMRKLYGVSASNHLKGMTKISLDSNKIFKIYILNNIPKIQFEAILAHELMHVWLYKNNLNLEHDKMEAFCDLGSYLIYDKDGTKFSKIHLISFDNNNSHEKQTKIYKILKSLMKNTSFNYILRNIQTIDIQ